MIVEQNPSMVAVSTSKEFHPMSALLALSALTAFQQRTSNVRGLPPSEKMPSDIRIPRTTIMLTASRRRNRITPKMLQRIGGIDESRRPFVSPKRFLVKRYTSQEVNHYLDRNGKFAGGFGPRPVTCDLRHPLLLGPVRKAVIASRRARPNP